MQLSNVRSVCIQSWNTFSIHQLKVRCAIENDVPQVIWCSACTHFNHTSLYLTLVHFIETDWTTQRKRKMRPLHQQLIRRREKINQNRRERKKTTTPIWHDANYNDLNFKSKMMYDMSVAHIVQNSICFSFSFNGIPLSKAACGKSLQIKCEILSSCATARKQKKCRRKSVN